MKIFIYGIKINMQYFDRVILNINAIYQSELNIIKY